MAETYDYVLGVDTHAKTHSFVLVAAATGAVVAGPQKFPATEKGFARALAWAQRRSSDGDGVCGRVLAAVEGTGSYGRPLTVALTAAGIAVTEGACQLFCVSRSGVRFTGDG